MDELVIPASVRKVGPSGLAMCDVPRRIEVGLAKPVGDNTSAVMYPVNDFYGMRAMTAAFSEGYIDPFSMQRSFDRAATCTAGMFERSRYIASRLADPFRLLAGLSDYFKQEILRDRERVFEAFCNHDYRRGFDQLVDAELIDENDLSLAIEVAGRMDNVAMSSYLLDLKHRSFAVDNDYGL